jgi:antitoxin component YwqK of YwqJK toxin-antitoxin module
MKGYLIAICALSANLCLHAQSLQADSLVERDGINYRIGSEEPYSGMVVSRDSTGALDSEITFKAGLPAGRLRSWYPNGQLQVQGELHGSTKVGVWKAWYANGKLKRQGAFKNGKEQGMYSWYFEDGTLSKQGNYTAGVENGKWVWYHPNGRRMQEGILKGDESVGTWKEWYPDGKPKMVGGFLNGRKHGTWTWWDEQGQKSERTYTEGTLTDAPDNADGYVEGMLQCMDRRDMQGALSYVDSAVAVVKAKNETDPEYMWLSIFRGKVYSMFQHLELAQSVLLDATGIPGPDVERIVQAHDSSAVPDLIALSSEMARKLHGDQRIAPHVALALVYNIVQDSVAMRNEQQWMMDHAPDEAKDWVLRMSLDLYKLQAAKEAANRQLAAARRDLAATGSSRKNDLALAASLADLGRNEEALPIVDKYLAQDGKDLDFLILRLNIAMGSGDMAGVAKYKEAALQIDPHALDE